MTRVRSGGKGRRIALALPSLLLAGVAGAGAPLAWALAPDAPTDVTAAPAGPGSAEVSWTEPAGDGGSAVTGYTATAYLGDVPAGSGPVSAPAVSVTVTGLITGQTYTFTVFATNADGDGPESAHSGPVTLPGPPGAPTNVIASPGNGSAIVTWDPPTDDGGAPPLTGYQVTPSGPTGALPPLDTTDLAISVTGLTNGVSYWFAVAARNAAGQTGPAGMSPTVTPATVPGPPTGVTATPGDQMVTVTWSAPADSGGWPVTSYTVTAGVDAVVVATATVTAPATTARVTGLVNGLSHGFSVTATTASTVWPCSPSTGCTGPPSSPVVATPVAPPEEPRAPPPPGAPPASGYWMLSADGRVFPFGDAGVFGHPTALLGAAAAVDLEPTPPGDGYWILDERGRVFAYGAAAHLGNVEGAALAPLERATSLSSTSSGLGYWVFTNQGRVLTFGDAAFRGDLSGASLNGPVLDSVRTGSGKGYYMVAADGGIFAFGDAAFHGSMGGIRLNAPVTALVPDADGVGYWLVAADGGIFAFDAPFRGSLGGTVLNGEVTGMVRSGDGYLMVGTDGGIFNFSDGPFLGSLGDRPPAQPIVSVAILGE